MASVLRMALEGYGQAKAAGSQGLWLVQIIQNELTPFPWTPVSAVKGRRASSLGSVSQALSTEKAGWCVHWRGEMLKEFHFLSNP